MKSTVCFFPIFSGQQQQPQQSQNTIPQSQPRRINQQSSRTQTVSRPQTPVRTTSRPVQTPPRPTSRPTPRPTPRPTSRPQTIVPTARPSQPRPTIRTNVQSIATQNRPKPVPAVSGPGNKIIIIFSRKLLNR